MNKISSQDRSALIRLASSLPAGNPTRKAILAGLKVEAAQDTGPDKKASSARTDPKKIAQEILDELHIDGGAPGPTPKSKYRGRLENLIANLLSEGFVFDDEDEKWETIISPEDDAADILLKPYKSGPKFNALLVKIFEEDHGDNG